MNEAIVSNKSAIAEFESKNGNAYAPQSVGTALAVNREAQEVQVSMMAAKNMPRDIFTAYHKIMDDCSRKTLAEKAIYSFPRSKTNVTGPSIHLARAIARGLGNLTSGFKVLETTEHGATVEAFCWDLETNYRSSRIFEVPNVRYTKSGSYPLTDPRDIYENIANQAARRERACILAVVPTDIVEAAVGQCEATLAGKSEKPLGDRIREMVVAFSKYGITMEALEGYIQKKSDAFSVNDIVALGKIFNTIRDGEAAPEAYFDMKLASAGQADDTNEQVTESPKRRGRPPKNAPVQEQPQPPAENPWAEEPASGSMGLDDI